MSYQIVIEERASADLGEAHRWRVENISPENGTEWYFDILDKIETLRTFPFRCSLALETKYLKRVQIKPLCFQATSGAQVLEYQL